MLYSTLSLTVLTTVQVMEDVVERAEPQEHADGEDFGRRDDSQQGENVLIVEHPVQYGGEEGYEGREGGRERWLKIVSPLALASAVIQHK